jgi:hypothetical protein
MGAPWVAASYSAAWDRRITWNATRLQTHEHDGATESDEIIQASVTAPEISQVVDEALRFGDLALGESGSRRALVRWSDRSEGEAFRWYGDEILVC